MHPVSVHVLAGGAYPVYKNVKGKGKSIPVTGHEGPKGCDTSRLTYFLDNRLTGGG
jgi:hypothetical protein